MNHALAQQCLAVLTALVPDPEADFGPYYESTKKAQKAVIKSLRAELAKPEPEPVAIYRFSHLLGEYGVKWLITSELPDGTLLYTKDQL